MDSYLQKYLDRIRRRNEKIVAARQNGAKSADLAKKYGISRQRVDQIVEAHNRANASEREQVA